MSMIVAKLFNRPSSISVEKPRKKKHFIGNREIKSNYPCCTLKFKLSTDKQDKAFYENGYIWYPFYELIEGDLENVYNIEVEEDHSYIAQGCVSKNCTSLSVAGKMEGMKEGSGTASSLLFEVKRIISELPDDQLPDIMCWENVPQCHSESNMPELQKWLDYLKSRGYYTYYEDLNAKDFGIPQNRERCFGISILSKEFIEFEFPKKIPLQYVMKDFLEDKVDEKYFIKSEKADKLIEQLIKDGKLD